MARDGLHRHAFWIYGVIVGLAIREALVDVLPHLFATPFGPVWAHWQEALRLLVFLLLMIRFYLGSAAYFEEAHCQSGCDAKYPNKNYALDFHFGLAHFIVFFMWALTIDPHTNSPFLFPAFLGIVLFYDLTWYLFCREYDTRHLLKLWTALNLFTLLLSSVFFLSIYLVTRNEALAEAVAYIPVLAATVIDVAELMTDRPIVKRWLADLIRTPGTPPMPESN